MPTLDELRALLREGIGTTKVPDIREGAVEWDLSGEADHLGREARAGVAVDPKIRASTQEELIYTPFLDQPKIVDPVHQLKQRGDREHD